MVTTCHGVASLPPPWDLKPLHHLCLACQSKAMFRSLECFWTMKFLVLGYLCPPGSLYIITMHHNGLDLFGKQIWAAFATLQKGEETEKICEDSNTIRKFHATDTGQRTNMWKSWGVGKAIKPPARDRPNPEHFPKHLKQFEPGLLCSWVKVPCSDVRQGLFFFSRLQPRPGCAHSKSCLQTKADLQKALKNLPPKLSFYCSHSRLTAHSFYSICKPQSCPFTEFYPFAGRSQPQNPQNSE